MHAPLVRAVSTPSPRAAELPAPAVSSFEKQFTDIEPVGAGGFGTVYRARSLADGNLYAVKCARYRCRPQVLFQTAKLARIRALMWREVEFLSRLDHPLVARYYGAWVEQELRDAPMAYESASDADSSLSASQDTYSLLSFDDLDTVCATLKHGGASSSSDDEDSDEDGSGGWDDFEPAEPKSGSPTAASQAHFLDLRLYIQMALYTNGTLQDWLAERGAVDEAAALHLAQQLAVGLEYVHAQGLVHRDLKPANVFLQPNLAIKIGDFGLAKSGGEDGVEGASVGTPLYAAPEQLRGEPCDSHADVYSFGLILCELFCSFGTAMERHVNFRDLRERGVVPDGVPAPIAALVARCVAADPWDRPDCFELVPELEGMVLGGVEAGGGESGGGAGGGEELRAENEALRAEVAALRAENEALRAENEALRAGGVAGAGGDGAGQGDGEGA